jgi:hypothetical protein
LWSERSKFESKGAQLIFIGNGPPGMIKAFKEDLGITLPIYTDPGLSVFEMAGFKRGILNTIGPKAIMKGLALKKEGHVQKGIQGDPWQQGGVLAVDTQSRILFYFVSQHTGDFPEQSEIIEAAPKPL